MHARSCSIALLLTALAPLPAQADRGELGLRLRAFERHLQAVTDVARRDAACGALDLAVQAFFRLDTSAVARAIATADAALDGVVRPAEQEFADSLQLQFEARLVATGSTARFALRPVWRSDNELPEDLRLVVAVGELPALQLPVDELPCAGELPLGGLPAGDHTVRWRLCRGDATLRAREAYLSVVTDRDARLKHLEAAVKAGSGGDLEARTLPALHKMLVGMTRKTAEETALPGNRLLDEAEALAAAVAEHRRFYDAARAGQFWLRVPTPESTVAVRLLAPPPTAKAQTLVLALHGAGGSENMFFDTYGDGEIVRQCQQRGFYLCAPRGGFGVPDLPALIDALAERYPFARHRVLLVGHSMGAAMAVAAASEHPERFAAVAALAGGGRVTGSDALKQLPFIVATGSRDFLRSAADKLRADLVRLQVPCQWREYAGAEHLSVVQFALPDVFLAFDRALQR